MRRLTGLSSLLLASGAVLAQDVKPNIVFILADDLGWKDLACYGNRFTETPNLDALARSGMLFKQAYAAWAGDYKLVENYETGKLELYNIKEDVSEDEDISRKMKGKTQELFKLLSDWRRAMEAQMPIPNPAYIKQR